MSPRPTLLMRHGGLWLADPWYRLGWIVGPQALGLIAAVLLYVSPFSAPEMPTTVTGHWLRPTHSTEESVALRNLRDQAATDPAALAQLDHQALAGNSLAQFFMGTLNDPFLHYHPKNPAVPATAAEFYRRAADQGVDTAAVNLGILLLGERDAGIPKDYAEARRHFERAAPTTPIGTRELGIMKRKGLGEPMDPVGGLQMIRTAAERGDAAAQRLLGLAYDIGEDGVPRDYGEAVQWYRKAAEQNDAPAQRQLGLHLQNGIGIALDPVAALDWLRKAAAQGDDIAQKALDAAMPKPN